MAEKKPLIFIDTCSLLDSCWDSRKNGRYEYSRTKDEMFWGHEFASLMNMGDVIIPKRNYEELIKHSKKKGQPDLASRSEHALKRIEELYHKGKLQIVGDPNDPFADAILLSAALKFKTQRHLTFVTQDRGLAEDLQALAYFKSLSDHPGHPSYSIKVRRIAKNGKLEPFKGLEAALKERYAEAAERTPESTVFEKTGRMGTIKQTDQPKPAAPKRSWWNA